MFGLDDVASSVATLAGKVIDRVWPDATEAEKARLEEIRLAMAADLAQMQVNQAEAASQSPFVAGWRPAVGWVCALSLAWVYLVHPLANAACVGAGAHPLPQPVDLAGLWPLVMGMLGMGGLRSFDKSRRTCP